MAVKAVGDILAADATVTAIVGTQISPLVKLQGIAPPAVTLQRVSLVPVNSLTGFAGTDENRVQVDSWANTYASARALATACRNALQAAGYSMNLEIDNYDPDIDPGLYRVTQDFSIWL